MPFSRTASPWDEDPWYVPITSATFGDWQLMSLETTYDFFDAVGARLARGRSVPEDYASLWMLQSLLQKRITAVSDAGSGGAVSEEPVNKGAWKKGVGAVLEKVNAFVEDEGAWGVMLRPEYEEWVRFEHGWYGR
ncbi:MAG: hypothetical protein Q9208_001402 [Pyrenodesmia sp. 3 TL-2023]